MFGSYSMIFRRTSAGARSLVAVVLAAGEGTRMRFDLPRVLHLIAGRPALSLVLVAVAGRLALAVEPGRDDVDRVAGMSRAPRPARRKSASAPPTRCRRLAGRARGGG
ncbi:hypothetical protein DK419_01190 [Methylobacterium terrae]|uniref:MobA-like NTP transferase domain-containing protein n=1 Tax=Methylobacterium terrae TaxID=2202827 RepID=A0A2U8WFV7_9HYPH|nr:hypothetical protein DK419_01190 [Methylobacterium terrae]